MEIICRLSIFMMNTKEKQSSLSVPRSSPPLTMRTDSPLWAVKKAEERWRPENHGHKLGDFAKSIGAKCLHISREGSPLVYLTHKKQMLPKTPKCSIRRSPAKLTKLQKKKNSPKFVKVKPLQHNFSSFRSLILAHFTSKNKHKLNLVNHQWLDTKLVLASLDFTPTSSVRRPAFPESLLCT